MMKTFLLMMIVVVSGTAGLAGSEKWYPAQTILEPTLLPDYSGVSLDIHGDLIYLGMISDRSGPKQQMGRIYRRHGNQWTLEQELSIESAPLFRRIIGKIQDDTCIVLGYYDPPDYSPSIIKAYAFRYDQTRWNLIQELVPPEGNGEVGTAIDIDSNICVIGSECIHVFRFDGQRWNYEQKIPAGTSINDIAISGNWIVTSCADEKTTDNRVGSAYFFVHDGNQWLPDGKLTGLAPFFSPYDFRQLSVAIDEEWCLLGVPLPFNRDPLAGKVFLCRRTDRWEIVQELYPSWPEDTGFGSGIFFRDGICGVSNWDPKTNQGSIALYAFNGSVWAPNGNVQVPMPGYDGVWNIGAYDDGYVLVEAGTFLMNPQVFVDCLTTAAVFRACPAADLTNDCRVDLLDFAELAKEWMK